MKKRILYISLALIALTVLYSCSGMGISTGFGLNFSSGPYGTSLTPSFNVGFGGGYYW